MNRPDEQSNFPRSNFTKMSNNRQRSNDDTPSTSSGSSDADQKDLPAPDPEEKEERKASVTQGKKYTKLSRKTTAELSAIVKRLQKELTDVIHVAPPYFHAGPKGGNIYEWRLTIFDPPSCVHEGGVVFLYTTFSSSYLFKPPEVTFHTRIYHCTINSQGLVCLNILKDNWSPTSTISKILLLTCSLWQTATLQILQWEALLLSI